MILMGSPSGHWYRGSSMFKLPKLKSHSKSSKSKDIPFQDLIGVVYDRAKCRDGPVLNEDIIYLVLNHSYYNKMLLPDFKQLSRYSFFVSIRRLINGFGDTLWWHVHGVNQPSRYYFTK
jgi:hypothetical protein